MRKQEDGETVDSFITALYELVEDCNYGLLREEMIRNRLVVGIRDVKLSERLQLDNALTLECGFRLQLDNALTLECGSLSN